MTAAAWYPDPTGRYEMRWWDGTKWTGDVLQHGAATVDPWPVETAGVATTHPADPLPPTAAVPLPPGAPTTVQPTVPAPTVPLPTMPPPGAYSSTPVPPMAPYQSPPPPAMAHPVGPATPPPGNGNRTALFVGGGVLAVAALAIGGFALLGGDDEEPTTTSASTSVAVSTTAGPTTTLAGPTTTVIESTTSTSAPEVSTTLPTDPNDALLAAMPGPGEVPDTWTPFDDSEIAEPADDGGYCGGPNWAGQAISSGAEAGIHGPNWDIESGGWFGVSAFTFPTPDAASAFVTNIDLQANGCMTDPVNYTAPESDLDLFADGSGDDAVWNVADSNGSFPGTVPYADEMTLVIYEQFISTNVEGNDYSVTRTELQRFERHGRTVLVFWLWGEHDGVGFSDPADWEYEPTEIDLDAAAATIRPLVVERLGLAGLV